LRFDEVRRVSQLCDRDRDVRLRASAAGSAGSHLWRHHMRTRPLAAVAAVLAAAALGVAPATAATKTTKKTTAKKTTTAKKVTASSAAPTTAAPSTAAPATQAPATAAPAATGGETLARIKKNGKIVIGVKYDVPLIGLKNPVTNQVGGFDVEIGKIIAKDIFGTDKGKIEWVEAISANRIPFIKDKKVDIILSTFSITDARKREVDFAGPYYVAGQDLLINKIEAGSIRSAEDLNGRKVCAQTGSTSIANIRAKAPRAEVLDLPTTANCVEALKDNRVDAVSTDDTLLAGFATKFPQWTLVGKQFSVEKYGVGLGFGDKEFRNYLNDVLEASFKDGSWAKAVESTIGTGGIKTPAPPAIERY
jgi:glutamate transport system substrate-binding protein